MLEAKTILAEQAAMETSRSNFESLWSDVGQLMLPRQSEFLGSTLLAGFTQGQAQTHRIFDETAMMALDHGCAVFEGEVIPQGGQWQRFIARDPALMKKREVALFLERLGERLFALRNSPYSGFANQTHESVASLLAFGFQGMEVEKLYDDRKRPIGLSYASQHIGQIYIREDARGAIETSHKKFAWTHRQAYAEWGDQSPECVMKAVTAQTDRDKKMDERAEYLHRITPSHLYDPDRIDWRGKPLLSCIVSIADKQVFKPGGYRKRPLICSRYEKSPSEDYGRSPGINCLPAVKASMQITSDLVAAIEFMARPALGAHDDMLDQLINYEPNGISYGAIDDRGNQLIKRLWEDPDIAPGLQLLKDTRAVIQRAFFEDLYIVRQQLKSHISASEQMIRDQQRGILLAPLKRQETEWFTPQTERELDLMAEMGMLDDMPQALIEAGGLYQTVYENPLGRARKAERAAGFYSMLSALTPLMQLNPEASVEEFFRRYPFARVLPQLAEVHGVPVEWGATDEEYAAAEEEARALADKASLLEVGTAAAGIVKDMAGAVPAAAAGPAI